MPALLNAYLEAVASHFEHPKLCHPQQRLLHRRDLIAGKIQLFELGEGLEIVKVAQFVVREIEMPAAATPTSISSAGTTMASSHRSLGSFCSALMSSTSDSYTSRWLHDVERGGREHGRHPAAEEQGGTRLLRQRIEVYQLGQRITSLQSLGILTQQ